MYLKSDKLLLADVFENFRKMCLKVYHLDPVKFLSPPGLAWEAALKKTEVKLQLLNDINMLLMVEKRIRGGICHTIHRYAKANNKYMKDCDKNKESSHIKYLDVNNLYLHDKTEYVIHIGNLKQALNQGLILKKIHRLIKFNQNPSLKPYIDVKTKLRQKTKKKLKKIFSS